MTYTPHGHVTFVVCRCEQAGGGRRPVAAVAGAWGGSLSTPKPSPAVAFIPHATRAPASYPVQVIGHFYSGEPPECCAA